MPEYILRAHSASVDPGRLLASVGSGVHPEYLAQVILNALFVSKGHRDDVSLTLVLENSADYSRAVSFDAGRFGSLGGQHEAALLAALATSLNAGRGLGKEQEVVSELGTRVSATSFEHIARAKIERGPTYLLDRDGIDIRDVALVPGAVFLLGDHVPMPNKLQKSLRRLGAIPISVGPLMLHASQCITIVQNEFDRRG